MKTLRLFISSPGDVGRERHATAEVFRRLQSEFAEHVTLDPYFWEWEPVDFSKDYQPNIPSTADFDIVICILWSRLGSRLSYEHKLPPDYTRPASSGTEHELLNTRDAGRRKERYPEMVKRLTALRSHLSGLKTRTTIARTVAQTEEILLDELREWQLSAKTTGH